MAYQLIEKKKRTESDIERVTISSNGRLFLLSSAVVQRYFQDVGFVHIYVENDLDDTTYRVALRPMKREEPNTFSIVKPRKSRSGYVTAKSTLSHIGYRNDKTYPTEPIWVERILNGKKVHVLEFGIEKKYCKQ